MLYQRIGSYRDDYFLKKIVGMKVFPELMYKELLNEWHDKNSS